MLQEGPEPERADKGLVEKCYPGVGGGNKEQGRKQNTTTTKATSGWKLNPDQKRCIPPN